MLVADETRCPRGGLFRIVGIFTLEMTTTGKGWEQLCKRWMIFRIVVSPPPHSRSRSWKRLPLRDQS
jgi:hypothetical protein